MGPTVTVVTPSYNQGRFLEETIRSVLAQRNQIKEYFILDGGGSDESQAIIKRYEGDLDYWASRRDDGQAAAIDEGFRRATGDILYWINSDDVLLPGTLELVRKRFASGARVVTGWDVVIDVDSRVQAVRRPPMQTLLAARWGVLHVSQPACFFSRDLYCAVGGLSRELWGVLDTELWMRMLKMEPRWGHIKRELAAFRVHPAQKGLATLKRIVREQDVLRARHPDLATRGLKRVLGVSTYRAGQLMAGRYLREHLEVRRSRGMALGEWCRRRGT